MVDKADNAYRNIRETANILRVKTHVLRFWESKFPALQPMTRGGGRRYYSPEDIALLETIKELLYERGLTIKAASRLIDKYGTNAVYIAPPKTDRWQANASEETNSPKTPASDDSQAPTTENDTFIKIDADLAVLETRAQTAIAHYASMIENIKSAQSQ